MKRYLLLLVAVLVTASTSLAQKASVTLTWDPNTEADLGGYRIYWGASSRAYTNLLDSGRLTTNKVANLLDGRTYYFAVTAYNTNGLESDYSNEVVITTKGRLSPPSNLSGSQNRDIVAWIELRGRTNSNGTITPIGDVMIASDIAGPVTVVANVLTNNVLMNSRTVTTTNRVASITGSRALARPFTTTIDVTRLTFDPDTQGEAMFK